MLTLLVVLGQCLSCTIDTIEWNGIISAYIVVVVVDVVHTYSLVPERRAVRERWSYNRG